MKNEKSQNGHPKLTFKTEWFSIFIITMVVVVAIWAYPQLPELVPSHWGITGEVDGWSTPIQHSLITPAILVGIYLLFLALPYIEPRRINFIKSWGFYSIIKNFLMAFLGMLFFVSTWAALSSSPVPMGTIVPITVGLLFILLGNYMPQIKSNFLMGIRTPWTLSSDENWKKTHRLGAYTFTIGGILFFLTPFLPVPMNFYIPIIGVAIAVFVPLVMSFIWFRQEKG
jgi:uncharacterized membrane protein